MVILANVRTYIFKQFIFSTTKFQNLTSRETLTKQKKQAEAAAARKRKAGLGGGTCNKKVFEDLERRADEEAARSVTFHCLPGLTTKTLRLLSPRTLLRLHS